MDLRKWFKKQGKNSDPAPGPPEPGAPGRIPHRRPAPPLPKWAKKDSFQKEEEKESPPAPDDVAEPAMIKRPGAWLKQKMGGIRPEQDLQDIEKTKKISKTQKNISDADMQKFLSDFLEEAGLAEGEENAKNDPGKKI